MANAINYKETSLGIGDTVAVDYKIKEAENKERIQQFSGIIIKIKGDSDATRMITVRKWSKSGTGVERIFPLFSPFIADIKVEKRSDFNKARAYFIRDLSNKKLRHKLYRTKQGVSVLEKKVKAAKEAKAVKEAKDSAKKAEVVETTEEKTATE